MENNCKIYCLFLAKYSKINEISQYDEEIIGYYDLTNYKITSNIDKSLFHSNFNIKKPLENILSFVVVAANQILTAINENKKNYSINQVLCIGYKKLKNIDNYFFMIKYDSNCLNIESLKQKILYESHIIELNDKKIRKLILKYYLGHIKFIRKENKMALKSSLKFEKFEIIKKVLFSFIIIVISSIIIYIEKVKQSNSTYPYLLIILSILLLIIPYVPKIINIFKIINIRVKNKTGIKNDRSINRTQLINVIKKGIYNNKYYDKYQIYNVGTDDFLCPVFGSKFNDNFDKLLNKPILNNLSNFNGKFVKLFNEGSLLISNKKIKKIKFLKPICKFKLNYYNLTKELKFSDINKDLISVIVADKTKNDKIIYNSSLIGLDFDFLNNDSPALPFIKIKKTCYFQYISTDEICKKNFYSINDQTYKINGLDVCINHKTNFFYDFFNSHLSNVIGINLIILLKNTKSDKNFDYVLTTVLGNTVDVNGFKVAPSASGSLDYYDLSKNNYKMFHLQNFNEQKNSSYYFKDLLKTGMIRELVEESHVTLDMIYNEKNFEFKMLSYARLFDKGGKPDFFAKLTIETDDVDAFINKVFNNYNYVQNKMIAGKKVKFKNNIKNKKDIIINKNTIVETNFICFIDYNSFFHDKINMSPQLTYIKELLK